MTKEQIKDYKRRLEALPHYYQQRALNMAFNCLEAVEEVYGQEIKITSENSFSLVKKRGDK